MFLVPAALAHAVGTAIVCLAVSNFCLEMVLGPAWAVPMDVAGLWSGTVSAIMNMAGSIGGFVCGVLAPWIKDWSGGNWKMVLCVSAAVYSLGAIVWLFLDPETPLNLDSKEMAACTEQS